VRGVKQRRSASIWRQSRWLVGVVAVVVGLVLGWIGLDRYFEARHAVRSSLDILYDDLKLLFFGGSPEPPLPWQLQVARFVAPIAFGYSAFAALLILFRDRVQQLRLPFQRRHVVVAGLGTKGLTFVEQLREQGRQVVAVEIDPASRGLAPARRLGALVVVGDATDAGVLELVGIGRAQTLIAVTSDAANAEIALRTLDVDRSDKWGPLKCVVHIVDAELVPYLQKDALDSGSEVRLEFFNVHSEAARVLLDRYVPPESDLSIVGFTATGERLALRATQSANGNAVSRRVTVVDPEARARLAAFEMAHPTLAGRITAIERPQPALGAAADVVFSQDGRPSTAVVCLDEANATIEVALQLRESARAHGAMVVAALNEPGALAGVLDRMRDPDSTRLRAVSLPELTCTLELVTGGLTEQVAREIHEAYRRERAAEGESADAALPPWETLSEDLRESNRHQALDSVEKLRSIGCAFVVSDDPRRFEFSFSPDEVELLARREHERWLDERTRQGWRSGPVRDREQRISPDIKSWEELDERAREKDRQAVRQIAEIFGRAGYQIVRV
jgi:voltage-gated potassium channel Kch